MDIKALIFAFLTVSLFFLVQYIVIGEFHIILFIALFVGVYNVYSRTNRREPFHEIVSKSGIITLLTLLVCGLVYKYLIDRYGIEQCQKIETLEFLKTIFSK